jgi:hypothetical protein
MISITKIIAGIWITTGLVALVWGTRALHNPQSRQKVKEQIKELAEELKITEEDCLCVLYVSFFVAGFAGIGIAAYRKIRNYLKGNK